MKKSTDSVCIRCGKLRIVAKTWKEQTKGGVVVHTLTVCPDPACQKIVEQQFANQKEKRDAIEKDKQDRAAALKIARQKKTSPKK
jgi:hypothetical protein